ncbi:long-chain-fatty-acid--CoA ligase [Bradyrhizobium sp. CCBAU 51627]|uniref:long-chain-fatty-acid--CoA ligase n=1 Tax=Bradyrhizobium sp. CCBAU 51627 TaxID=1325088 RepID=UPI002306C493|nr:long-chain-fatty-acid--CoA ligase [Bradyrhizobium sp. CCBAU 51627]MDA9433837.1 long-chain fatty acid--CoA ligase [Bradyrhizobium sp. CCBAU 51627]
MLGLMQEWPLLCHRIIDHAATCHPDREVVTRSVEGPIHRTNYGQIRKRALKVAQRLDGDGILIGDRVATLAWNTWRHLEIWYGIMGIGAVCHTINPRLFPEQIAWIINHARDRVLLADVSFVPLLEKLASQLEFVERFVILTDCDRMPITSLRGAIAYESWIDSVNGDFAWKSFDENTAAGLCYTSGTTGNPKGVLYSHRSNVLHSLMIAQADVIGLSCNDTVLPVVPLFHANSWGLAFHAPMVGSKIVFPGAKLDGASVYELLRDEKVTFTAGVPTVWLMLQQHMESNNLRLPALRQLRIGGAAPPPTMIEAFERMGIAATQGWGMTEMGPVGSMGALKHPFEKLTGAERIAQLSSQGVAPFLVEMKITDDSGERLPHDGRAFGRLKVRGASVVKAYYGLDDRVLDKEGYFDTGDVATIDEHAYMRIADRSKDVIKSGGEWISSIEIENVVTAHPSVLEAAAIAVSHPKWGERPLLIVQLKPGLAATKTDILSFLEGKIAKWWMPDDVVIDSIPHTATGKIRKSELRERYRNHSLPGTSDSSGNS